MNQVGSGDTPGNYISAQKKKKRNDILNNKSMNIWQKKFLLEQLDEQYAEPAPKHATPSIDKLRADTGKMASLPTPVAQPKHALERATAKNPFTYLSIKEKQLKEAAKNGNGIITRIVPTIDELRADTGSTARKAAPDGAAAAIQPPEDKPGSVEWLKEKGVPVEAARAMQPPKLENTPGSVEWLINKGVPPEAAKVMNRPALPKQPTPSERLQLLLQQGVPPEAARAMLTPVEPQHIPESKPAVVTAPPVSTLGPLQPPERTPTPTPPAEIRPEPGPAPDAMEDKLLEEPDKYDGKNIPALDMNADKKARYQAEKDKILTNSYLSETAKSGMLKALDLTYGYTTLNKGNAAKLQSKIDELNALNKKLWDLQSHGLNSEIKPYQDRYAELMKEFGIGLQGLYSSTVDPAKVVDIKLDGKAIGNAKFKDGMATGNLDDVVKGLGGDTHWDKFKTSATVYGADGKEASTITMTSYGAIERDLKGNIIKRYSVEGGQVQADIQEYASRFGVPYSYYHDKNGVYRAYTQPEMKDAPIQVVRREDQIIVDAFVSIDTDNPDVVKKVLESINNGWNDPNNNMFNIDGTPQGQAGGETVKLKVNVHAKDNEGNSYNGGIPVDRKYTTINLNPNDRSHVYTTNSVSEIFPNAYDALKTGELEKVMYNWKITDQGNMWLSRPEDAAHEFGHLLGVGDAYGENGGFYRLFCDAPADMDRKGEYGKKIKLEVPTDDLMRGGTKISAADVYMLLNASRYNQPQYFDKIVTPEKQAKFVHFLYSQLGINLPKEVDEGVEKMYEFIDPLISPKKP